MTAEVAAPIVWNRPELMAVALLAQLLLDGPGVVPDPPTGRAEPPVSRSAYLVLSRGRRSRRSWYLAGHLRRECRDDAQLDGEGTKHDQSVEPRRHLAVAEPRDHGHEDKRWDEREHDREGGRARRTRRPQPSTKTEAAMTTRRSPQRCMPAKASSMTAARSRAGGKVMRKD